MSEIIEDGAGSGYKAEVNKFKRLATQSTVATSLSKIGLEGGGWTLSTGIISLTSANESALAYLKNTGTDALVLRDLVVRTTKSNESTGTINAKQTYTLKIKYYVLSTSMTTPITPVSLRPSREKSLSIVCYSGAEGATASTVADISTNLHQCGAELDIASGEGYFFLEPNASIAITFTPPAGNTSMSVSMGATIYKDDGSL